MVWKLVGMRANQSTICKRGEGGDGIVSFRILKDTCAFFPLEADTRFEQRLKAVMRDVSEQSWSSG